MTVTPSSQSVAVAQTVKFTALASGIRKENFTYQWRRSDIDLEGETEPILSIANVSESSRGEYECIVRNEYGDSSTSTAKIIVTSEFFL